MSHFFVGALVPKNINNISNYIEDMMSSYNENIEVEKYISKTKQEILAERLDRINKQKDLLNQSDAENKYNVERITEFISELENQTDEEYAYQNYYQYIDNGYEFDENGNELSTYNPKSKWDWWVIGGRWNGVIKNKYRGDGKADFNFGEDFHNIKENMIPVENYIKLLNEKNESGECQNYPAYAYVSVEDGWVERGQMGWWGMSSNEKDFDDWKIGALRFLEKYKDYNIVGLDCHI